MTKKTFKAILFSSIAFFAVAFTGCHDNIFGTIKDEVALNNGLAGTVNTITQIGDTLYLAAQRKGYLLKRNVNTVGFNEWQRYYLSGLDDYYILYARDNGGALEVLVCIGFYDNNELGYRTPRGYRTYKQSGNSWTYTGGNDTAIGSVPPNLVAPFTNALLKVTVNGITYDATTGGNGGTKINGIQIDDDSDVVSIYGISATSDYLLIATQNGLFKIPYSKTTGAIDAANKSKISEEGYSNVTGVRTTFVFVPDAGTKPYNASTVYACRGASNSSQSIKNDGLYAVYRTGSKVNEWNKDGTDEN